MGAILGPGIAENPSVTLFFGKLIFLKPRETNVSIGMAGVTEFNSKENLISQIRKRDARIVSFVHTKISNAIYKALVATRKPDYESSRELG